MPNNPSPRPPANLRAGPKLRLSGHGISPGYAIAALFITGLLGLIAWWFFANFERVSHTDYQLRAQAQLNPYYAAELLINRQWRDKDPQNVVAISLLDADLKTLLNDLPPLNADKNAQQPTLIINSIGRKLTQERFEQLRDWVEQGGHLITFTTDASDYEDMQAVLARLRQLQGSKPVTEIINDSELTEQIAKLNTGNQFLSQLGIYAVAPKAMSGDDNSAESGTQLDALITEMQDQDQPQSEAERTNNLLTRLAAQQPLSLLPVGHPVTAGALDASTPATALLVQSEHYGQQLNTDLLQAWYPQTAKVHRFSPQSYSPQTSHADSKNIDNQVANDKQANDKQANDKPVLSDQAALIRQYLLKQQRLLKQSAAADLPADPAKAIANRATIQTQTAAAESRRLNQLLTAILALNDEQLLALFKPIDDIYLDIGFGKGRISVMIDSGSFTNPNPNLELPKDALVSRDADPTASSAPVTPLANWLNSGHFVSLLSADNAAWLIDLTQDSSQVWIFPHVDIDPLPVMLWRQARPALLGLVLLVLLWLWSLFNRFGKMAHLPDDQAHDILRYFRQVGRFGWQQDRALRLMTITRDRVAKQLKERQLGNSLRLDTFSLAKSGSNDAHLATDFDMAAIHQFLITQLEQKTQQLGKNPAAATASNTDTASDTERAGNGAGETAVGDLLVSNQAFIRGLIAPERLRAALVPAGEVRHSAVELTQMTQTLWTVQWLLK